MVVRVSTEVLVQDAVWLRRIELPADRQVRRQTGKTDTQVDNMGCNTTKTARGNLSEERGKELERY